MENRMYDQHRDVLHFYLYYSEEQGDPKRTTFFRERLKELEATAPTAR
jgi:hypothetical protein